MCTTRLIAAAGFFLAVANYAPPAFGDDPPVTRAPDPAAKPAPALNLKDPIWTKAPINWASLARFLRLTKGMNAQQVVDFLAQNYSQFRLLYLVQKEKANADGAAILKPTDDANLDQNAVAQVWDHLTSRRDRALRSTSIFLGYGRVSLLKVDPNGDPPPPEAVFLAGTDTDYFSVVRDFTRYLFARAKYVSDGAKDPGAVEENETRFHAADLEPIEDRLRASHRYQENLDIYRILYSKFADPNYKREDTKALLEKALLHYAYNLKALNALILEKNARALAAFDRVTRTLTELPPEVKKQREAIILETARLGGLSAEAEKWYAANLKVLSLASHAFGEFEDLPLDKELTAAGRYFTDVNPCDAILEPYVSEEGMSLAAIQRRPIAKVKNPLCEDRFTVILKCSPDEELPTAQCVGPGPNGEGVRVLKKVTPLSYIESGVWNSSDVETTWVRARKIAFGDPGLVFGLRIFSGDFVSGNGETAEHLGVRAGYTRGALEHLILTTEKTDTENAEAFILACDSQRQVCESANRFVAPGQPAYVISEIRDKQFSFEDLEHKKPIRLFTYVPKTPARGQ